MLGIACKEMDNVNYVAGTCICRIHKSVLFRCQIIRGGGIRGRQLTEFTAMSTMPGSDLACVAAKAESSANATTKSVELFCISSLPR